EPSDDHVEFVALQRSPMSHCCRSRYLSCNSSSLLRGRNRHPHCTNRCVRRAPGEQLKGPILQMATEGRALFALPVYSNVDLLRDGERIIHVDAEIPDGALYLRVT